MRASEPPRWRVTQAPFESKHARAPNGGLFFSPRVYGMLSAIRVWRFLGSTLLMHGPLLRHGRRPRTPFPLLWISRCRPQCDGPDTATHLASASSSWARGASTRWPLRIHLLCNTYNVGLYYATPDSASSTSPGVAPTPAHDAPPSAASTSTTHRGLVPPPPCCRTRPRRSVVSFTAPTCDAAPPRRTRAAAGDATAHGGSGASSALASSIEQRSYGASPLPPSSGPTVPHLLHRCMLRGPYPLRLCTVRDPRHAPLRLCRVAVPHELHLVV
jgi:hypothetical protein